MNINIVKTYGVALTAFCICSCSVNTQTQKNEYIVPGEVWNDTEGNPVNAHGGGIMTALTIGMASTRKERQSFPTGLLGSAIVRM